MTRNLRPHNRNGVTLLFVVSMIVLFLLMGTAFVVVSNDFRRASVVRTLRNINDIASTGERLGDRFIRQALYDLVRGPNLNNINSPLRGHSLLGDMYGFGMTAFVEDVEVLDFSQGNSNEQFLRLQLQGTNLNVQDDEILITHDNLDDPLNEAIIGNDILTGAAISSADLGLAPGRFNGLLLSFVSGALNGVTARVVDHQVFRDTSSAPTIPVIEHRFVVMVINEPETFQVSTAGNEVNALSDPATDLPDRVVINGRPFSGTGAGMFNPTPAGGPALSMEALLPNRRGESRTQLIGQATGQLDGYLCRVDGMLNPNPFSTNEPYDAADEQNMFLAGFDAAGNFLPSFHRPTTLTAASSFRPEIASGTASNNFPGANVAFAMRNPEVDHDGDGTGDGIWMDIGLPTFTTRDGKRVKPLVSYLVADMDGRININVHGNRSQLMSNNLFSGVAPTPFFQATNPNELRGMGYGPAEVDLTRIFPDDEAERLMVGVFDDPMSAANQVIIPGRFGYDFVDPTNSIRRTVGGGPAPGIPSSMVATGEELFFSYKEFGLPLSTNSPMVPGTLNRHYRSSPMDIYGRMRIDFPSASLVADNFNIPGIPVSMPVGMPTSSVFTSTIRTSERFNSPYEVDFSPPGKQLGLQNDMLFTLNELEHVFRQGDPDMSNRTDSRILDLLEDARANHALSGVNRFLATTESWEVPTTYLEFLGDGVGGAPVGETMMTKLFSILNRTPAGGVGITAADEFQRYQMATANITGFLPQAVGNNQFNTITPGASMLSVDVRAGRPFNINQPFGDGIDNDNDFIVDEVGETGETVPHPSGNQNFDHDNNSLVDGFDNSVNAKAQFGRQLYVLTLLATELIDRDGDGSIFATGGLDNGDFFDFNGDGLVVPVDRQQYRETVAQWVANVIDYRDADSIMTGFEYDLNPWDGWDVDGDIATTNDAAGAANRRVAWGVERPELLMTESIALHDVRTQDRDDDDDADGSSGDFTDGGTDNDYDSHLVPQASAFIELYHPWIGGNQILPAEFDERFAMAGADSPRGVNLTDTTGNPGDNNDFPVWRIVAVRNPGVFGMTGLLNQDEADDGINPVYRDFDAVSYNVPDDEIVRFIYFAEPPASSTDIQFRGDKVYAPIGDAASVDRVIQPGQFAVVGSRGNTTATPYTTYISRVASGAIDPGRTRRIELDEANNEVRVYNTLNFANPDIATGVQVLPIEGPVTATTRRSLGFSDPVDGYENLTDMVNTPRAVVSDPMGLGQKFVDPMDMTTDLIMDEPIDKTLDDLDDGAVQGVFYDRILAENQLTNGAYVLVLQRLANPTVDWNANSNPYRTVDTLGCDLYSFNGVEGDTEDMMPNPAFEPYLGTFERRGDRRTGDSTEQELDKSRFRMLWKTEYAGLNPQPADTMQQDMEATGVPPTDVHALNRDLAHSLGRMNDTYVNAFPAPPATANLEVPFAWLSWNNRPFSSAYELVNVPAVSSSYLTSRFDTSLFDSMTELNLDAQFPYNPAPRVPIDPATVAVDDPYLAIRTQYVSGEYPHLLNFFANDFQFFRLFDYVETRSRYLGTETYVNPTDYYAVNAGDNFSVSRGFAPPFDYVSNYRVPGKLNINTIYHQPTWEALVGIDPNVANSSNGRVPYAGANGWQMSRNNNPFRPSIAANRVPIAANVQNPVNTGLFRVQGTRPLFDYAPTAYSQDQLNNANRNAYYRYHERQRIANSVTNRSSIFAIWIEVGYFEVEDVGGNEVVGAEYRDEDGNADTDRGFFIIDRSIPVAFEPGRDHNIERAIRVSSYIE